MKELPAIRSFPKRAKGLHLPLSRTCLAVSAGGCPVRLSFDLRDVLTLKGADTGLPQWPKLFCGVLQFRIDSLGLLLTRKSTGTNWPVKSRPIRGARRLRHN